MPRYVEYNEKLEAIWVDWDNTDDPEDKYNKFQNFLKSIFEESEKTDIWILDDNQLIPQSGPWGPKDTIEELKPIIQFMNDNKIEWVGEKVVFLYGIDIGFIVITDDNAILAYIDDEGEVEKEYIPLTDTKKLI